MPNWCYESAVVSGPRADVLRFREAITVANIGSDGGYNLNWLYPCPQELMDTTCGSFADADKQAALVAQQQENIRKYDYKDWYDWCIGHYGTKWGACNVECDRWKLPDEDTVSLGVRWESAWSPSTGLVREVSRQHPTLTFAVFVEEEMNSFIGWYVLRGGELLRDSIVEPERWGMPKPPETDDRDKLEEYYERLGDWMNSLRDSVENAMYAFLNKEGE